ncbi:hypothetical protein ACQEV4_32110 [Streptomyces shenzhenensis]|uniref:hypothetical protein n=1 Tax=Streptomyces shenzhenensis TaxID=943815 RepID=UPI003D944D4B
MICPSCQASLLRKERAGSVCSSCGRAFALDPKVHGRGMHDTRIRRIAEHATDGGRRQITVTQLWYLARNANRTWTAAPASGRPPWIGRTVGVVLVAGLVALGFLIGEGHFSGLLWWAGAAVAALVYMVAKGRPHRPARRAGGYLSPSLRDFRSMICVRWVQAYGSLPPGIVDDEKYQEAGGDTRGGAGAVRRTGGQPRAEAVELLCPDRAVRVFLAANGFPRRLNLTLAARLDELSGTGPVMVLHDADVRGLHLVADTRASLPQRVVVDAGLPVRAVVGNSTAVKLHEEPPAGVLREQPPWLARIAQAAPEEAAWLIEGWRSPVAAVPPALLASAVERAVQKARGDRERQPAAAVGFMSWPEPAAPKDGT